MDPLITAAAVGGLATQLVISSIHEFSTIKFLGFTAFTNVFVFSGLLKAAFQSESSMSILAILSRFLLLNTVFVGVIFTVTAIRRLFFHPLRTFPGKKMQALTSFHMVKVQASGKRCIQERNQHRELGDFVRTGPNELSINNVCIRVGCP